MFNNPIEDNFQITLPSNLITPEVNKKYMSKLHDVFKVYAFENMNHFIETFISSITLFGFSTTTIGSRRKKKSGQHAQETMTKEILVKIRHTEGYMTLLPIFESAIEHYKSAGNKNLYIGNFDLILFGLTEDEIAFVITFKDCYLKNVPSPVVNFIEPGTFEDFFEITFGYNDLKIEKRLT